MISDKGIILPAEAERIARELDLENVPYAKFAELTSLLKNSLYARFGPRSRPKHTVFGAFWSLSSPMRSHCELSADFFNRL